MKIAVSIGILFVIALACSPQATPTPATPPPAAGTPIPMAVVPTPGVATIAEDASWQEVIKTAQREGKVTVYSFSITSDVGKLLARAFKERYGITLDIITGTGSILTERIRTEARSKQRIADILEGSTTYVPGMFRAGVAASLADMPALREKDMWRVPPLVHPEMPAIYWYLSDSLPVINTKLVKPEEEPKSYLDLIKPQWKGKMGWDDPVINTTPNIYYVFLKNHKIMPDAEAFYREFGKQDIKWYASKREAAEGLARGDYALYPMGGGAQTFAYLILGGAPVKLIAYKEGHHVSGLSYLLVKDAPHPNAAKTLANWLLGKEGQEVYAKAKGVMPIRSDLPDFTAAIMQVPAKITGVRSIDDDAESDLMMKEQFAAGLLGRKR